jgi:hypothetical protein
MTPTPEGKLPSLDRDPRVEGVMNDLVNIALTLAPLPGAGAGMGVARGVQGLMRRVTPIGAREAEALANKSAGLYNPPRKPPRPLEADYPAGATADAAGRLSRDIEGRPLIARRVVGRRMAGGTDEAVPPTEFDALAEATTGQSAEIAPARQMGQDAGRTVINKVSGLPTDISLRSNLTPGQLPRVYAHELGHAIDAIAGQIPVTGLNAELRQIYSTLNTGQERTRNLTGPQHLGYRGDEVPRELIVEAIRAYMTDPNYLKTVAPKTAARIREFVNSHPTLSKIIQFNSLAGPIASGIGTESPPPTQAEPVFPQ